MINLTQLNLAVYEVLTAKYDEDFQYTECIDSEYVVVDREVSIEDIISAAFPDAEFNDELVQVYEARTADFTVSVDKSGKVTFDATGDIDCATGCSGSPIYEAYYNKNGEQFDPEDLL